MCNYKRQRSHIHCLISEYVYILKYQIFIFKEFWHKKQGRFVFRRQYIVCLDKY